MAIKMKLTYLLSFPYLILLYIAVNNVVAIPSDRNKILLSLTLLTLLIIALFNRTFGKGKD